MTPSEWLFDPREPILVTGATGFIGPRVVKSLLTLGCRHVRCLVRPASTLSSLRKVFDEFPRATTELVQGSLSNPSVCRTAVQGVSAIVHLAATSDTSYAAAVQNCVVTTRNLLEAARALGPAFKRFANISSFSVYSNYDMKRGGLLDEHCALESHPFDRHEPYCYAKLRQDRLVLEYHTKYGIPYVILRPGTVYGPGITSLSGRIGIGTFGIFMNINGRSTLPLTYVENCADAIALATVAKNVDSEVFNIVDDDLPTSRQFLRQYRTYFPRFKSLPVPYSVFYAFSYVWEKYSHFSRHQLPPVFNRRRCATYWKGNRYSNAKLKALLGWQPRVSSLAGIETFFSSLKAGAHCDA